MIAPNRYAEQTPDADRLVAEHLPLVQRIAWHYGGRIGHFAEIEELMQAGYLGLVDASQRYSLREGVTFAAYAAIRIRGSIVDFLRRNSNLCRATIEKRREIKRAEMSLEQKLGRTPERPEIAAALGLDMAELQEIETRLQVNQLQSLDEVYTDHSPLFAQTDGGAEEALERAELKEILRDALADLPEREALVLQLYFVEEMNVYEVAAVLEVTTGRVSQIKKAAIGRLREKIARRMAP